MTVLMQIHPCFSVRQVSLKFLMTFTGALSTPFVLANATQGSLFVTFASDYSVVADGDVCQSMKIDNPTGIDISFTAEAINGCSDMVLTARAGVYFFLISF